jgi:hypothetical protein
MNELDVTYLTTPFGGHALTKTVARLSPVDLSW